MSKKEEKTAEYYYKRGTEKYNNGDNKGAIEDFSKCIDSKPTVANSYIRANAYLFRASSKENSGNVRGAMKDYHNCNLLYPNSQAYYNLANIKITLDDNLGAIEDADKAIKYTPTFADAFQSRGAAKSNLKDYGGAINDFTKVIEMNPDYWGAYQNRAISRVKIKEYQGAIEDFTKVLENDSENAYAYQERGNCKRELKDYQGALEDYNKGITIVDDDEDLFKYRSEIKTLLGDIKGAEIDKAMSESYGLTSENKIEDYNKADEQIFEEEKSKKIDIKVENKNVTHRDLIIKKLETLDKLEELGVIIKVCRADETATVIGDYLGCPFNMYFETTWNTLEYKKNMSVSEIIDLLKSKSLDDMTIDNIEGDYEFYLSDNEGMGEINVLELVWDDKKPNDEDIEGLDTLELYMDGIIDNSEYSFIGVDSIKIESKELDFSETLSCEYWDE